jgi:cytidylate kinase
MIMKHLNIALDGPAGAGKSTIASIISQRLGILHLDTGAMYRAVAYKAIKSGIKDFDTNGIKRLLPSLNLKVVYKNNRQLIILDGEDITSKIRTPQISDGASKVAVIPEVRLKLVEIQREIADNNDLIIDGRDIGTYVLPEARYKFFLTASLDERAKRRWIELRNKNICCSYEEVLKDIEFRDKNDSSRAFAPLKKAEDAILVDTTGKSIEQVVDIILSRLKNNSNL